MTSSHLNAAYRGTSYMVEIPDGTTVEIRCDRRSETLDRFLAAVGVEHWAFVTACNPRSTLLNEADNARHMARLDEFLEARGLASLPGWGRADAGDWPPEPSRLVLGVKEDDAIAIGRRFEQNAILTGSRGTAAKLVWIEMEPMSTRLNVGRGGFGLAPVGASHTTSPMSAAPSTPVIETDLPLGKPYRGKVRDCYRLRPGQYRAPAGVADTGAMLIVSTDRISAFDWVLPTPIPDKGKVLTAISTFWFDWLSQGPAPVPHHLISADVDAMGLPAEVDRELLRGRSMLVRLAEVIPFECVVREWLAGSGLAEYRRQGTVCGVGLPAGLVAGSRLPEPIFTPATKAQTGHDENVSFDVMAAAIGTGLAATLREKSLDVFRRGAAHAAGRGIVIADTKFEWGVARGAAGDDGTLLLVDEVLTPDSSRFWPAAGLTPGRVPDSFDKQFVRDWLDRSGWDKQSPPPPLPDDVVAGTREKYLEACRLLTGRGI